jgi:hypothetical protein
MSIYIGYQSSSKSTEIRQNPSVNIDCDIGIRYKGRSIDPSVHSQRQTTLLLASAAIGMTKA